MTRSPSPLEKLKRLVRGIALWRFVRRFRLRLREREIARNCGCVTYCPKCRDPLNDQAYWLASNGEGRGTYKCRVCGNVSEWHFGIAPVAVLLWSSHTKSSPNTPDSATEGRSPKVAL